MLRIITVEAIEERTTQQGQRYWRVRVVGEKRSLFVWDPALAAMLIPGGTYHVELNGSADYPRITGVTLVPDTPTTSTTAAPPAAPDRERRMLRMSALRAAAEVLHGSGLPADQVVAYADELLRWLES